MLLLVIPGLLLTVSCSKKSVKTDSSISKASPETVAPAAGETAVLPKEGKEQPQVAANEGFSGQGNREVAPTAGNVQAENTRELSDVQKTIFLGELVLFEYDRSILTPEAQKRLSRKAVYLKENPEVKVIIEGHCDERGTNEYNLALGERRASATRDFLVDLGIPAARLTTISYGEERPFTEGNHEQAWALNRRAHFVVE